ncbi:CAC1I protein, partial [Polypterus senegalus]
MMVILLNCVTLGMYQPCENIDCSSERCQILQWFDAFIYIFFALEMVVKMVALGIFGRKCYLGDTWNRLDFFIVMAGLRIRGEDKANQDEFFPTDKQAQDSTYIQTRL